MAEAIEYEQFDKATAPTQADGANATGPTRDNGVASPADVDLSRLSDIPMELSVEIGRTHMTVGETLDLRVGSVVALERLSGETADLLVNGTAIARGEVVVIDEQYGLRITEIVDAGHEAAEPDNRVDPADAARVAPADGAGDRVDGGEGDPVDAVSDKHAPADGSAGEAQGGGEQPQAGASPAASADGDGG